MIKCRIDDKSSTEISLLNAEINREYEIYRIVQKFEIENLNNKQNLNNNRLNNNKQCLNKESNSPKVNCSNEINAEFALKSSHKLIKRLSELGFLPKEKIVLLKKSFLKKTLLIKIKGYALLINSELAKRILIK